MKGNYSVFATKIKKNRRKLRKKSREQRSETKKNREAIAKREEMKLRRMEEQQTVAIEKRDAAKKTNMQYM